MEPTIKQGESITADIKAFASTSPCRWDVVVFEPPGHAGQVWASRIVGLPGEVIDITLAGLTINGKKIPKPSGLTIGSYAPPRTNLMPLSMPITIYPYHLPPDGYFVLGDNANNSLDSRYWGSLKYTKILGKVIDK